MKYRVEFYSKTDNQLICWYETENKQDAMDMLSRTHAGVRASLKG
jgi:hypothetical protein